MDNVRVFYLRDKKGFPVACVASTLVGHKYQLENMPKLVRFALSVYNHSDRISKPQEFPFIQARGREIALGRLTRGRSKCRLLEIEAGEPVKASIVQEIHDTTIRPQVKEACELWLEAHATGLEHVLGSEHVAAQNQADGHA